MKKTLILGLVAAGILWSCGNAREIQEDMDMNISNFSLGDTTSIGLNDIVLCNDDLNLFIQFDTIYTDSRCPIDANCIWEGNAEVGFSVTYNKELDTMKLNTNPKMDNAKTMYGYKFELIDLMPYPGQKDAESIAKAVKLKVTKE